MKSLFKKFLLFSLITGLSLSFQSCEELLDAFEDLDLDQDQITDLATGWFFDGDNIDEIPDDINFFGSSSGGGQLPSSVMLTDYFPVVGDQGQHGTCVSWAVAYSLRTFLYARVNNLRTNDLTADKRFSAKDHFFAIPANLKGTDCNGTGFHAAFNVMVERGVARESVAPYDNLGDCSGSPQSSWNQDASNHKILRYRQIDQTVNNIKTYLSQGRAVAFGAKLGQEFFQVNSDAVYSSQSVGYDGQHSYHAMVVVGYDDERGNGAFRVKNSWNTWWGDDGFVWVDYNFFVNQDEFAFASFVAANIEEEPDLDDPTSGFDLQAWNLEDMRTDDPDYSDDPRERMAVYNVYNTGDKNITPQMDWNVMYLYYNAYDANDFGVILYDMYTTRHGAVAGNCDGDWVNGPVDGVTAQGYWATNCALPAGSSIAGQFFGSNNIGWSYRTPENMTGHYYLVLIADGFDVIPESNEDNNYYFFAHENGDPIQFTNGIMQNPPISKSFHNLDSPVKNQASNFGDVRIGDNLNAYAPREIMNMIQHHRSTGELQERAYQWYELNKSEISARRRVGVN